MKQQDRARFRANIQWFNEFFDGIRSIYEMVVSQLPVESFPSTSAPTPEIYYFPRHKVAPSIPPYYALLLEGHKHSLQIVTVVDANLIARNGFFIHEPSIITVLHTQASKAGWVDEFAMNVIQKRNVESFRKEGTVIWGHINSRYPADFFAFQVALDNFSGIERPQVAVRRYIVDPLLENMVRGFPGLIA